MQEKTRFMIVAGAGIAAGGALMALIDRMAMKQDLEFLGIVYKTASEAVAKLTELNAKKDEPEGDKDE